MGGAISQLGFGAGGDEGSAGQKFSANGANIQQPVSTETAQNMQKQAQEALNQQLDFANAVKAQNGLGNQTDIYNQLGGVAAGTGPNPAMAALNQATGQNTANQAALMAGQRGAGANTGLMARQAAIQGAANQQNAIGQGAMMQAQQSLNALGMQGGIAGQQVGQQAAANQAMIAGTQGEQANLLGAIANQNNAATGSQSSVNSSNASIASGVAAKQSEGIAGVGGGGGLFGMGKAHGGVIEAYAGGGQAVPTAPALAQVQAPQSNFLQTLQSLRPQQPQQAKQGEGGGAIGNIQSAYKMGKQIYNMLKPDAMQLQPGDVAAPGEASKPLGPQTEAEAASSEDAPAGAPEAASTADASASDSPFAYLSGAPAETTMAGGAGDAASAGEAAEGAEGMESLGEVAELAAHGGVMGKGKPAKVPAMVSPGEIYLPPRKAQAVAEKKASPMDGERIPGKAKVKGDSLKNDTVPKTLEAGGVVIPRSIMEAPDAAKKAAKFVAAHLAAKGHMPRKPAA